MEPAASWWPDDPARLRPAAAGGAAAYTALCRQIGARSPGGASRPLVVGEVAEWSKANDSKSFEGQPSVGSNPTLSVTGFKTRKFALCHSNLGATGPRTVCLHPSSHFPPDPALLSREDLNGTYSELHNGYISWIHNREVSSACWIWQPVKHPFARTCTKFWGSLQSWATRPRRSPSCWGDLPSRQAEARVPAHALKP